MSGKLLPIVEYPNPVLTTPAEPVDLHHLDEVQDLIDDMFYTMFFMEGVGLAAPQVGRSLRIFVIDQRPINGNVRVDPWVFINPTIEVLTDNMVARPEGCLSFPDLYVEPDRPEWVQVTAYNRHGAVFTMDASHNHLFSVALQHENDHLNGITMHQRSQGKDRHKFEAWAKERRPRKVS